MKKHNVKHGKYNTHKPESRAICQHTYTGGCAEVCVDEAEGDTHQEGVKHPSGSHVDTQDGQDPSVSH